MRVVCICKRSVTMETPAASDIGSSGGCCDIKCLGDGAAQVERPELEIRRCVGAITTVSALGGCQHGLAWGQAKRTGLSMMLIGLLLCRHTASGVVWHDARSQRLRRFLLLQNVNHPSCQHTQPLFLARHEMSTWMEYHASLPIFLALAASLYEVQASLLAYYAV